MTESQAGRIPDLAALYEQHGEALMRVAAYNLAKFGAAHLAPDAVHEVFTKLVVSPPEADVLDWESYLVRTVQNRAIDMGRKEAGHDRRAQHAADEARVAPTDDFEESDIDYDIRSAIRELNLVLTTLPDVERDVLLALYRDRMASKDIAAVLGVTAGRVSQLKTQALQHVREALKSIGGTG